MRDKKDNATFDLPGFEPAAPADAASGAGGDGKRSLSRAGRAALKQEQLPLIDLDAVDATGLPVWQHDPNLDLTGLPIWQPPS